MNASRRLRGAVLLPRKRGVDWWRDGVLELGGDGRVVGAGPFTGGDAERFAGIALPGMVDLHTHVPQWPIRGHFLDGVPHGLAEGRLLAGLERNVFPTEMTWADLGRAERDVAAFVADTQRRGVVGGCAFLTAHAAAAESAMALLPATWSAGVVLMNQNCPDALHTKDAGRAIDRLHERFGRRLVVTDRFAVACSSAMRRPAATFANTHGLLRQTHLNEQVAEKRLVEQTLYPDAENYTDVYDRDGLLDGPCVVAHCVQNTPEEWDLLKRRDAIVAHCPTSNLLLGSGVMPLDAALDAGVRWAICTDVGASPTTSLLAEMAMFLKAHHTDSASATEALRRVTVEPAAMLGIDLAAHWQVADVTTDWPDAESAIRDGLLGGRDDKIDPAHLADLTDVGIARHHALATDLAVAFEDVLRPLVDVSSRGAAVQ